MMNKKLRKISIIVLIPLTVFFTFIVAMHLIAWDTGLKGFRGGPQDAFRHSLASAYVSRYLGAWAVEVFTVASERNKTSSYDQMDWHNNNIGKLLGQSNQASLFEAVSVAVKNGKENSEDPNVIRWLPEKKWANFLGM